MLTAECVPPCSIAISVMLARLRSIEIQCGPKPLPGFQITIGRAGSSGSESANARGLKRPFKTKKRGLTILLGRSVDQRIHRVDGGRIPPPFSPEESSGITKEPNVRFVCFPDCSKMACAAPRPDSALFAAHAQWRQGLDHARRDRSAVRGA